jgi:hypothetical protein
MFAGALALGLEGVVAKDAKSPYFEKGVLPRKANEPLSADDPQLSSQTGERSICRLPPLIGFGLSRR